MWKYVQSVDMRMYNKISPSRKYDYPGIFYDRSRSITHIKYQELNQTPY